MKPGANGKAKASAKARQEKATPTPGFAEFFLEIGCEEIPAGMIANAANELQVTLKKYLVLERLIDTIMRKAIEHAGAQRGLLVLVRDQDGRAG